MPKPKEIKNLRTGALSRGFTLARLGVQVSAKIATHAATNFFASGALQSVRKKAHLLEQAALFSQEIGQLKGSLMKAGQMLSVYGEHFLPPEVNQILKTLQSDSIPVTWKEMEKALKTLGKEKLALLEINSQAEAAASLGQVHRAKIKASGQEIVLKIQYPGVDKAIEGDMKTLKRVLSLLELLPKLPATDDLFAEVKSMLKAELDYEREQKMLEFFGKKLAGDARYILPKVHPEFSNKKILALDYEPGVTVDSEAVKNLSQEKRNALADSILDLYFQELFVWHKVQTDPHFGNYRIRLKTNQWILFDYGAVREVPQTFLKPYKKMLNGIFYGKREVFEEAAASLGLLQPGDTQELKDLFYGLCALVVEPFLEDKIFDWQKSDLPKRVSEATWEMLKFPLRAPPREVVFLDRKMAGMFTILAVLGAKTNGRKILERYLEQA